MDKIFIRERINIVNYDNENQGLIYTSSDADITGGAVNITLESDVGGWHQLEFDMPAFIVEEGKHVVNPLTKNLFPLAKLQYTRTIKSGDNEEELILYFIIQPQENSRDDNGIVLHHYSCIDYPRHVLSKSKNGLTIGEDTLDPERSLTPNNELEWMNGDGIFYIPAPVQSKTFDRYEDLLFWGDAKPGAFAWVTSEKKGYRLVGENVNAYVDKEDVNGGVKRVYINWHQLQENQSYTIDEDGNPVPEPVWSPEWGGYPLAPDINNYDYGSLGIADISASSVIFYWDILWVNPDKTVGRYDGILYSEGSRLLYNVYQTLDFEFPPSFLGSYSLAENLNEIVTSVYPDCTAYVRETNTVWQYKDGKWEDTYKNKREVFKTKSILKGIWDKLAKIEPKLSPNTAEAYLGYVLEGTGWKVGTVDKIYQDTCTLEFNESGYVEPNKMELRCTLAFDNSNAYNGISEICDAFKTYPRFDHVNKTVDLRSVPGDDYGLTYQWRDNLANTRITQDGEKAVSKLWVYGGEAPEGETTIADCNRMNPDFYLADYVSLQDLKDRSNPKEGNYAKVTTRYTWGQITAKASNPIAELSDISKLPATGSLGEIYWIANEDSYWAWFPEGKAWYDTMMSTEGFNSDTEVVFEQRYDYVNGQWKDMGQFYHWYEPVSPCADNYILDFSYFLDRKLMTEEQVEDVKYNYILPISRLNKKRWPLIKQYYALSEELLAWNNTYDESSIAKDAIQKSLRTTYAIYEKDDKELMTLKELEIHAYPPGADIPAKNSKKDVNGWTKANIVYSDIDAIEVATYSAISAAIPNPYYGQYVKVQDEVQVYYWNSVGFRFEDTICNYLGYTPEEVKKAGYDKAKKELLDSPDGRLQARVRTLGLFQQLRDEELVKDKEREVLADWYNPPANINEVPAGPVGDPTSTSLMHTYYNSLERLVTEQITMNNALEEIAAVETEITLLLERIELLENRITEITYALKEKYGDFIVEGVFTDDTQVWIYNLWYAGLEALQLYHRPLVTYDLGVVDISGLPEYRTMTPDVYHDIVYRMNQPELVLPSPGDYCYVTDNTLGLVKERANVTSITRNLSNPSQHTITIATVDTNTEDLIGKLVTAANTIYSKEQIYNRSAIINADGTIAKDNLKDSLEDNSGEINIISNNGTVIFGDTGITTVDREDSRLRMQYTGKGIFASTNAGTTWENIVSAGKISIKSLSAGSIDSNTISVSNIGHDTSIIIDGKGITALRYDGADETTKDWTSSSIPDQVSFFLDANTGNAFFRGRINSGSGLIGGWSITEDKLFKQGSTTNKYTGLSSSGDYAFWAGNATPASAPFWVKHDGTARATGLTLANGSDVGGWKVQNNNNGLNSINGRIELNPNGKTVTVSGFSTSDTFGILAGTNSAYNFGVSLTGNLYAQNAHIAGEITATSGNIGGWKIDKTDGLYYGNSVDSASYYLGVTGKTFTIGGRSRQNIIFKAGSNFGVTSGGIVYANTFYANGTGDIAGWNINSGNQSFGTEHIQLYSNGRLTMKNVGWLNCGEKGYWLLGKGSEARTVIGDSFDLIDTNGEIKGTTLGEVSTSGVHGVDTWSSGAPTVAITAANGHLHLRALGQGSVRIATTMNGGICLASGYGGVARTGQVSIYGSNVGDGQGADDCAIFLYAAPSAKGEDTSIRLLASRNLTLWGASTVRIGATTLYVYDENDNSTPHKGQSGEWSISSIRKMKFLHGILINVDATSS